MIPAFSFEVDVQRNVVCVTLSGFFQPTDVQRFEDARDKAHRLLRCEANEHFTLADIRGMKIQAQESVQAFANVLRNPAFRSKRLAFVLTQSLARLQVQRATAGRDEVAYFVDDLAGAKRWLLADPQHAA